MMSLIQHTGGSSVAEAARTKSSNRKMIEIPGARKIATELLPGFSRRLAAMLSAGMPIVASLNALERQVRDLNFKIVITKLKRSVENGSSFSESLRQFPAVFDNLYCNMIRGGETSGQLPETIARLSDFLQASVRLRKKVKSAMMYPLIVLSIAAGITAVLLVFVVPVFADLFAQFKGHLPAPTQALLTLSALGKRYGLLAAVALAGLVILFKKWKATPAGAHACDRVMLSVPVFGDLNRNVASARFARTFAQLTRSGVPILTALEISAGATGNKIAEEVVLDSRKTVENGEPLSEAMLKQTVFPGMLAEMLQAGEKTGKVDQMLDCIADFYDEEVEITLNGLTSLLEPLLMVFLGVIIGGIVICMFLPIFKIPTMIS
jgi:type IV pilus assembly protein PilC